MYLKNILNLFLVLIAFQSWNCGNTKETTKENIDFGVPNYPSYLRPELFKPILEAEVFLMDSSNNKILEATESASLIIIVKNKGKGIAKNLVAYLSYSNINGMKIEQSKIFENILSYSSYSISLPIRTNHDLPTGKCYLNISFTELNNNVPRALYLNFRTKKFEPPNLILVEGLSIEDQSKNGKIEPLENVTVKFRIQNIGNRDADNVLIKISKGENINFSENMKSFVVINKINSGKYFDIPITFNTNKYTKKIDIFVEALESYKKYGFTKKRLKIEYNKEIENIQIIALPDKDKTLGLNSDTIFIDIENDIPISKQKNPNAIAVIIGISEYANKDLSKVEYAKQDAMIMREYLIKVLGYDAKNILPHNPDELITSANMKTLIKQLLPDFVKPDGSSDIFIYYSGHGAPSTTSQKAFFVPYDCNPNYISEVSAYEMSEFYSDIQKVKSKSKTIVIDACFSGQSGDGGTIIKNASPLFVTVDNTLFADKNAIVFQSSQSSQVSNWYPEKKHGMFTYYFLKGLKGEADLDEDGSITVNELERFINDENNNLPYVSRRLFSRPQKAVVTGKLENVMLNLK